MKLHANAALSLNQRRRMVGRVVEQGWSLTKAAEAAEVSDRTCAKWVGRYRAQGEAGLRDRSSAPKRIPHRTPVERVEVIELLRRLRMTGAEIAECLGMALSTVSAVLKRIGLGKLSRLDPLEPPNRYERRRAGELLHVDQRWRLGRRPQPRAGGEPGRAGSPRSPHHPRLRGSRQRHSVRDRAVHRLRMSPSASSTSSKAAASAAAHLTVSVPCIPAARCPSTEQ
jgi:transposase